MNIVLDPFFPVTYKDNSIRKISLFQIVYPHIIDITSVTPSFKSGYFILLISLLQTIYPPETVEEWAYRFHHPPSETELKSCFKKLAPYFNFSEKKPSFLQDYDLENAEIKSISALLIESPAEKTLKENKDHFIKRGKVKALCNQCTAIALFILQSNAPSGGQGHRVGVCGGGPLRTLLLPDEKNKISSLWEKLWLNVIPMDVLKSEDFPGDFKKKEPHHTFPWLAPTRTSEKNSPYKETFPVHVPPFQVYFAMPRRIKIDFINTEKGECDLCGEKEEQLITQYQSKNLGINYSGAFIHPLTPYRQDSKDKKLHLPCLGQKSGITFREYFGIALNSEKKGSYPAMVVKHFIENAEEMDYTLEARIWAFGYDMNKMKARAWYDTIMPIYPLPSEKREVVSKNIREMIETAVKILSSTKKSIKDAWYPKKKENSKEKKKKRPGDDSFIDVDFGNI